MTPFEIDEELNLTTDLVRSAVEGRAVGSPDELASVYLAVALGRALETGVDQEAIEQIIAKVLNLNSVIESADEATGNGEQLDAWFDACAFSVGERIDEDTPTLEVFAHVLEFAAGTALGTGLSVTDANAIVQNCSNQLATARGAQPPPTAVQEGPHDTQGASKVAVLPREYDAPT